MQPQPEPPPQPVRPPVAIEPPPVEPEPITPTGQDPAQNQPTPDQPDKPDDTAFIPPDSPDAFEQLTRLQTQLSQLGLDPLAADTPGAFDNLDMAQLAVFENTGLLYSPADAFRVIELSALGALEFLPPQALRGAVDATVDPTSSNNAPKTPPLEGQALADAKQAVQDQIERELAILQAQEESLQDPELVLVGGPRTTARPRYAPTIPVATNDKWDNALNLATDPLGLLGEVPSLLAEMREMEQFAAKQKVDDFRKTLADAGVKNLPEGYRQSLVAHASGMSETLG
jgi:hypothetical protein